MTQSSTPPAEKGALSDEGDPGIACDYPVCIGGECCYECERGDKHKEFIKERNTELRALRAEKGK